jgi:hypothetical protein
MSQSFEGEIDSIPEAVKEFMNQVDDIWECDIKTDQRILLITIYQRAINYLLLLANSALEIQPQLQALRRCSRVGSDAFVNATLADDSSSGLETSELAHGVIWEQGLHRRDPQLQDVPKSMATKLTGLLQAATLISTAEPYDGGRAALNPRDIRHAQSSQAYALIQEIRAIPGLERFMRGETFKTLQTTASTL